MAYDLAESYELPVNKNSSATIAVPAVELERLRLGYNDGIKVTLEPEYLGAVEELTFTAYLAKGDVITIPSDICDKFGIDGGRPVTVSFDRAGERWSPEVSATARKAVYQSAHPEQQDLKAVTEIIADGMGIVNSDE
jgi:hypothetical protein